MVAALVMNRIGAINMKIIPTLVSSSQFTHVATKKVLVAELSDLGPRFVLKPLYDDACDIGLAFLNERTGSVTTWYFTHDVLDGDGDLMHVELRPTSESVASNPAMRDYTMILIND